MNQKVVSLRKLILPGLLTALIGCVGLLSYQGISTYQAAYGLNQAMHAGDLLNAQKKANVLAGKMKILINLSKLPLVHRALIAGGFNFSKVETEAISGIKAAPYLLGTTGPKKYLVAFQNSAEARGTGGILGAFAVVSIDRGSIKVVKTGSNTELHSLQTIPIPVPKDFAQIFGTDPAIWQNSNMSPHFPIGAQIWLALWQRQFNEKLDGVIALDPIAISYFLKATGPILMADGEKITSDDVVKKTLVDAYARYANDIPARKKYLVDILNSTARNFQNGRYSKPQMVKSLIQAISENRFLVYSTDPESELKLSDGALGGVLETSQNNQYRIVVINTDASKLDYYLKRKIKISSIQCGSTRKTRVEVSVQNAVLDPQSLPDYVLGVSDKGLKKEQITGVHKFALFIYGPKGSHLLEAAKSSAPGIAGGLGSERGHPVLVYRLSLGKGKKDQIIATFAGGIGTLRIYNQPLVSPPITKVEDKCLGA
jgi:hypothetical protein